MNIVDSSLWIEYFLGNAIDRSIIDAIRSTDDLLIPVICLYEVHKKFLSADGVGRAEQSVEIMQNAEVIGITPQIAILAAKLGRQYKLPMADSIIYATAQIHNASIYTQDSHFDGLHQVHYFEKR